MSMFGSNFSIDRSAFDISIVGAGDAAEMETRLTAAIRESASPPFWIDTFLTGVGEGPEWRALSVFAKTSEVGGEDRVGHCVAAVAGSREEAYLRLKQKIDAAGAGQEDVLKVEIAGGGDGTSFMALAIVGG